MALSLAVGGLLASGGGPASGAQCASTSDLTYAGMTCDVPRDQAKQLLRQPASPPAGTSWTERKHEFFCTHDRITAEDGACAPCNGADEDRYSIQERTVTVGAPPSPWRVLGYTCLSAADLGDVQRVEITPGMAATEFRRLSWPQAPLTLQPGEGMTLVNMVTTAYSENAGPQTRSVTLLGQQVEVEATPDSWSWHWGDGTAATTTHPGEPAPRGDVTHAYERASDEVRVRVDITYRGRFRVNGGGWQDIPDTATVRGDATPLEVREAVVQLVR